MTAPVLLTARYAESIMRLVDAGIPINTRSLPTRKILSAMEAIAAGQTRVIHAPSAELVERCKSELAEWKTPIDEPPIYDCLRDLLALIGETP